ncbi:MAG: hypothetical protein KatS3mg090_0338 [Patescibacteria group bacterium]|nr:MAG: hypothetical protein KatS3mg090_0338 [Patescibacteria group bacterium]
MNKKIFPLLVLILIISEIIFIVYLSRKHNTNKKLKEISLGRNIIYKRKNPPINYVNFENGIGITTDNYNEYTYYTGIIELVEIENNELYIKLDVKNKKYFFRSPIKTISPKFFIIEINSDQLKIWNINKNIITTLDKNLNLLLKKGDFITIKSENKQKKIDNNQTLNIDKIYIRRVFPKKLINFLEINY